MRIISVSCLIFPLLANVAIAQQPTDAQRNAIKQSCRSDYMSYCSSVPTGGRASLECLQQHMSQLSGGCQQAVGAIGGGSSSVAGAAQPHPAPPPPELSPRQEMALMRQSCGSDYRAYCNGVQPGGGRAIACLMRNEENLSPRCKTAMAEARGPR